MESMIKKIPVPIAGLALALAALGNLFLSYGAIYKNVFGAISALILILLIIKIFIDSKGVLESLKNPVVASVTPTFSMCLMLLSNYIKPYLPTISFGVWIFALLLQCFLIIYFTVKFIFKFDMKKVFPSYFIVYVGIVVGSITAPTYGLFNLGKGIFWFGFIAYLCLLPIIVYRMLIIKAIPEAAFPLVISAIAIKQTNVFLIKMGRPIYLLKYLVGFQEILAFLVVIYVLINYFKFIFLNDSTSIDSKATKAI